MHILQCKLCPRIRQRYFLVVMCMFGFLFGNLNRFSFDLIMKSMFYSLKDKSFLSPCFEDADDELSLGTEEFLWRRTLQRNVLAGWMLGKIFGLIPLALLTEKFGAKTIFGYSVLVPGICSAITPLCARSSPYALIVVRFIGGFFMSTQIMSLAWMAARWFPLRHRGLMISIVYIGIPLGFMFTLWYSYIIIDSAGMSWTTVFYVNGVLAVVFAYIWQLTIWDDPFDHPYITDDELILLARVHDTELAPGWRWPWRSIFQTRGLWLLMIVSVGQTCFFTFATFGVLPVYFPEELGYNFLKHQGVGTVTFLAMAAGIIVGGVVGDVVVSARQWLSMTQITKTYVAINCILGPLLLVAVVHSGCNLSMAMFLLIAALVCEGIAFSISTVACLYMAPNYVATTSALIVLPRLIISPAIFSLNIGIIALPTKDNWMTAVYLNAVFATLTTVIFLQYGKIQPQLWNEPQKNQKDVEGFGLFGKKLSAHLPSKRKTDNIPSAEDNLNDEPGDKRRLGDKPIKRTQTVNSISDHSSKRKKVNFPTKT